MKTVSDWGRRPAWSRATSALWDSPLKLSTSEMRFDPIDCPMAKARRTNASQPQKAFLRCLLLQRAIRAARLCEDGCESIFEAPDEPRCVDRAWSTGAGRRWAGGGGRRRRG